MNQENCFWRLVMRQGNRMICQTLLFFLFTSVSGCIRKQSSIIVPVVPEEEWELHGPDAAERFFKHRRPRE